MSVQILQGDCREVMKTLPDNSVDSIVTDPPYELGFMGKSWDSTGVANDVETWRQCLRVLKPGGHLLAFGGTRTQHRMVCAIEDAGFEVRDQIGWLYGSGFPKSLDVSKAIDKAAGATRQVIGTIERAAAGSEDQTQSMGRNYRMASKQAITEPATEAACQWQGWGTALKPAWEPVCMARKPLIGTVAVNVLAHGVGALNIDGCRIEVTDAAYARNASGDRGHAGTRDAEDEGATNLHAGGGGANALGRWPANVIHDGSDDVVAAFPAEAGASAPVRGTEPSTPAKNTYGKFKRGGGAFHADSGTAARFFYCAKADRADRNDGLQGVEAKQQDHSRKAGNPGGDNPRNRGVHARENHHPTVKPTDLMRYLCRLVTPRGGGSAGPIHGQRQHAQGGRAGRVQRYWHRAVARLHRHRPTAHCCRCTAVRIRGGRMSYHSDNHNTPRDTRFVPVGLGLKIRAHCMGCGQYRTQAGGKGRAGPRWRCAHCVAAKAGKAAG